MKECPQSMGGKREYIDMYKGLLKKIHVSKLLIDLRLQCVPTIWSRHVHVYLLAFIGRAIEMVPLSIINDVIINVGALGGSEWVGLSNEENVKLLG